VLKQSSDVTKKPSVVYKCRYLSACLLTRETAVFSNKQLSAASSCNHMHSPVCSTHQKDDTVVSQCNTFFLFNQGVKENVDLLPVIGASGRDCSFLHAGTNTVISLCPFSRNQSTASWIPRQENPSLFPWLKNMQKF